MIEKCSKELKFNSSRLTISLNEKRISSSFYKWFARISTRH